MQKCSKQTSGCFIVHLFEYIMVKLLFTVFLCSSWNLSLLFSLVHIGEHIFLSLLPRIPALPGEAIHGFPPWEEVKQSQAWGTAVGVLSSREGDTVGYCQVLWRSSVCHMVFPCVCVFVAWPHDLQPSASHIVVHVSGHGATLVTQLIGRYWQPHSAIVSFITNSFWRGLYVWYACNYVSVLSSRRFGRKLVVCKNQSHWMVRGGQNIF